MEISWMKEWFNVEYFSPLDSLVISRYYSGFRTPRWFDYAPNFRAHPHLATQHVESFIELISNVNVTREDIMMKMFVLTLKDHALQCFRDCCPREISSFAGLIRLVYKHFDYVEEEHDVCICSC